MSWIRWYKWDREIESVRQEIRNVSEQVAQLKSDLDSIRDSVTSIAAQVADLKQQLQNHPAAPDLTDIISEADSIKQQLAAIAPESSPTAGTGTSSGSTPAGSTDTSGSGPTTPPAGNTDGTTTVNPAGTEPAQSTPPAG